MTMLLYISVCLRTRRDTISYSSDIYSSETAGLKGRVCRVWQKDKLPLTIHDTSHFSKGNAAMCHGANKIQKKKLETSGFRKSEFRIQNSEFRKLIWETGFQNRETGILKVGNWTGKLQNSDTGIQNSEFRNSELRIQKLDREIIVLKVGNWTGKLQDSELGNWTGKLQNSESRNSESRKLQNSEFRKLDRETSGFRKLQNRETGPGNFRIQETSEFRNFRIQETGCY